MKELFLQTPSILSVLSLLILLVWLVLVLLKKPSRILVWVFMASHYLLYIDAFLLEGKGFILIGSIMFFITLFVCIAASVKKGLGIEGLPLTLYWFFLIFLFVVMVTLILIVYAFSKMDFSFLAAAGQ